VTQVKRKSRQTNQLRIIGGTHRGRKLNFPDVAGLRPTSDRIRETLFNWLQADVIGAKCLDLFAGSGALGFEALSRGAAYVHFIDTHQQVISQLKANAKTLGVDNCGFWQSDAISFLNQAQQEKFELVFLDPPFQKDFLPQCIQALENSSALQIGTKIYIEMEKSAQITLPENWQILKNKKAGQVNYTLLEVM